LQFCDQVAYSQQSPQMTEEDQSQKLQESTDSAPDTKSAEQGDENIWHCKYSRKGKEKVVSERQGVY